MKNQRKSLGNKLRFDVFKRDLFTCQYCGKTPPSAVLEVDHIIPVAKGGKDEIDNLITSCFECNRGKRDHLLNTLPESTSDKLLLIKEKEDQYREYQKMLSAVERRIKKEIDKIDQIFTSFFDDYCLSESFKSNSVRRFINELGYSEVAQAMEAACSRINNDSAAIKYFCGICWSKIKSR